MQVVILCTAEQQAELGAAPEGFIFIHQPEALAGATNADLYLDLLFETDPKAHLSLLRKLGNATIVLGAVVHTGAELPGGYLRINAWPGFLSGRLVEACGGSSEQRRLLEQALALLQKQPEWVPDVPGMISARVVCSIINEAYFALGEGIATREAIDTAMQLGTAYPRGPFAWEAHIGKHRVLALLRKMALEQPRYKPAPALAQD